VVRKADTLSAMGTKLKKKQGQKLHRFNVCMAPDVFNHLEATRKYAGLTRSALLSIAVRQVGWVDEGGIWHLEKQ
jgi:hypothetical protein